MKFRRLSALISTIALLVTAGCSGSSPEATKTTSSATRNTCTWTSAALQQPGRVLMLSSDASAYLSVDVTTGRIIDRCQPDQNGVGGRLSTVDQLPALNGRRTTSDDDTFVAHWFGGARPGGPDHDTVVTVDGVLDLATGKRTRLTVDGFVPAAVGASSVVMVRSAALSGPGQPVRSQDWCVVSLRQAGTCRPVPGASGAGSPVVAADGSIVWLTNELTMTDVRVTQGDTTSPLFLRTGHGVVTALATKVVGGASNANLGASPDARGFLVPPSSRIIDTRASGTVVWYSLTNGRPTPHASDTTWRAIRTLTATDSGILDDVATSTDGRTLFLFIDVARGLGWALVAVPQHGSPRVLFNTSGQHGDDPDYAAGAHMLAAPVPGNG